MKRLWNKFLFHVQDGKRSPLRSFPGTHLKCRFPDPQNGPWPIEVILANCVDIYDHFLHDLPSLFAFTNFYTHDQQETEMNHTCSDVATARNIEQTYEKTGNQSKYLPLTILPKWAHFQDGGRCCGELTWQILLYSFLNISILIVNFMSSEVLLCNI